MKAKLTTFALVLGALLCLTPSCTDDSSSRDTLHKAGYTDVQLTGYTPFSCSDSDKFSTGFRAVNTRGIQVEGVVCCGLFKNCTIRF